MPTWRDNLEEQQQQHPALLNITPDQLAVLQQQRMPTDELSFNQWAHSLGINPTGAAENMMVAMENMSVTRQPHGPQKTHASTVQAATVEV